MPGPSRDNGSELPDPGCSACTDLAEYRAGLDAAREVGQWPRLRALLHRWRLRAAAYSDPEFDAAAQAARRARPEDLVPLSGWDDTR